jgi:hypothetical protein
MNTDTGVLTDPQDLHSIQRILEAKSGAQQYKTECSHTGAKLKRNEVLDVVEDALALLNCPQDSREIVVRQNHVRCLLGNIGAKLAHRNTYVGFLQSGRIVNTITSHGNYVTAGLKCCDNLHLVIWACTRKDRYC